MKKLGHILARRLRGDLLLTDDPLTNRPARIITPGAWLTDDEQDIDEWDATPNYLLGTRMVREDRVFRYCKAATDIKALYGCDNSNVPKGPVDITIAAGQGAVVDSKTVVVTLAGATLDQFAEGYFVDYMTPATPFQCCRIKSNTVSSGTDVVTFTLYDKLYNGVAVGDDCAAYHNIYSAVIAKGSQFMSVVCVPPRDVPNGKYFWGQTWGPTFGLVAGGDTPIGLTAEHREVWFHATGGGIVCQDDGTWDAGLQIAGFLLCDGSSFGNGDQFYMLQLAP